MKKLKSTAHIYSKHITSSLIILFIFLSVFGSFVPAPVKAQESICTQPHQAVSLPLTELGKTAYIRMDGQSTTYIGGLYPDGSNTRPIAHEAAGLSIASQIQPLEESGNPAPVNGKIVLISVGMSNTSTEFNHFISIAHNDQQINPQLVLVNGAQGGRTADRWVDPMGETWQEVANQLGRRGVTPEQVQVAWVKQTLIRGGDFPGKAMQLQADLEIIARNLKQNYPNIKIAFFSSRTRSYTYWRGLSPEPVAFETGFAVKWMIEKQINQDPALNFDPQRGEVVAPFLSWGPYLWVNGEIPRADGLVWLAEDMTNDCTHPSQSGSDKVAQMLMTFFKSDTITKPWFLTSPQTQASATLTNKPAIQATETISILPTETSAPTNTTIITLVPTTAPTKPTIQSTPISTTPVAEPNTLLPMNTIVILLVISASAIVIAFLLYMRSKNSPH